MNAAEEMVQSADEMLADLEQKRAELDEYTGILQREIASIEQARQERAQRLQSSQSALPELEIAFNQAQAYAKLAQGTANQAQAVKALSAAKKAFQQAKKAHEQLVIETQEQDQVAEIQRVDLSKRLELQTYERDTRLAEIAAVKLGRQKAAEEVGVMRYTDFQEAYEAKQQEIEGIKADLLQAEVDLHDLCEQAVQNLARWPRLQKEVNRLIPGKDATQRVIEAGLHYAQTLANDSNDVNPEFRISSFRPFWEAFDFTPQQTYRVHECVTLLQHLLNDYHEAQGSQE